jgi:hypothetical protein
MQCFRSTFQIRLQIFSKNYNALVHCLKSLKPPSIKIHKLPDLLPLIPSITASKNHSHCHCDMTPTRVKVETTPAIEPVVAAKSENDRKLKLSL